jgi:hypothetical protein
MDEVREFWGREGLPAKPKPAEHDVLLIHGTLRAYEERHPEEAARRFQPAGDRPAAPA